MLLVTKTILKLPLKDFYTLIHFTQLKSTLVNCELRTVSQDFIIVVCDLRFYLCALCKYSRIVFKFCIGTLSTYFIDCIFWTDHISLYKLDLSYLCIIITNHYPMYLNVETHFVLCLLLSNDIFYIHSDGFLEY
jgi:hypothetical protein